MSKLKTYWAIRTTDEQFKAYVGTLGSLGYPVWKGTKAANHMATQPYLVREGLDVYRGSVVCAQTYKILPDISSFLVYHFSEEKTEAEKELEALQEKMNSLQEQVDRVKLSISK